MKKVILLVLAFMLVSVFLTASAHPGDLLRLSIINKSGNEIYLRLQSFNKDGGQFYYLTIPAGTKTDPEAVSFTIVEDIYYRTTWFGPGKNVMCQGQTNTGELVMDRNNRLVFLPCNSIPIRQTFDYSMMSSFDTGDYDIGFDIGSFDISAMIMPDVNIGEPSMEKVIASDWQKILYNQMKEADMSSLLGGLSFNTGNFDITQYMAMSMPSLNMCQWRYQYEVDKSELETLQKPSCQPNGCE